MPENFKANGRQLTSALARSSLSRDNRGNRPLPRTLPRYLRSTPMARRKLPEDSSAATDSPAQSLTDTTVSISLEAAMAELQEIAARLESGQESLDQSLTRFERGMQLLRICHQQLDHAAQRIEIVTRVGSSGVPETQPFDGRATFPKEPNSSTRAGSDDDDALLF